MQPFKEWNVNGSYGTYTVKVILEELVSRKNKYDKCEQAKRRWSWFALLSVAILLMFGYRILAVNGLSLNGNVLSVVVDEPFLLLLILLFCIAFFQIRFFDKKAAKAEKEFDELRFEVIERNTELWEKDQSWEMRERLYSFMKQEHDINLYHK